MQSQPYKDSQARGLICLRLNHAVDPRVYPDGRPTSGKTEFGEGLASGRHKIHYDCIRASICVGSSVQCTFWSLPG